MSQISTKLNGYYRRLKHEVNMFQHRTVRKRKERVFNAWLNDLERNPPFVFLGANFAQFGGVKHHIHAIQRHSKLDLQLAPPARLMEILTGGDLTESFREQFFAFEPNGIRVLHSHVFPWFTDWCMAHRSQSRKWIHTYHLMYYPEHSSGPLLEWQEDINRSLIDVARHADVCLSVSKWQCLELRDEYGIDASYLPNGVDVSVCDKANSERCLGKLGLDRFVLYVGRNDPVKNPVEFIRLAERIPDERFVMIGGGLSEDSLREEFSTNVPDNITILGAQSLQNVQDAVAACSVLVVTSKREGLPTLVLEGMTHETPLVVPDEKGCMEAVDAGRFGDIYHLGDIDDLEAKVVASLKQGRRDRSARARVLEEYDWRVVAEKLDHIYQEAK